MKASDESGSGGRDWPASQEKLLERFREANSRNHGIKEFIGVLMFFMEHGYKEVIKAVEAAVIAGVSSREVVEHLLRMESGAGHDYSPMPLGIWPALPSPNVSVYLRIGDVR